jgi:phosphatidylserine/phosphatidylglycerophosphate/cardiolipin synthase-like enzyme
MRAQWSLSAVVAAGALLAWLAFFNSCSGSHPMRRAVVGSTELASACDRPVAIGSFLSPQLKCYAPQASRFDTVYHFGRERWRTPGLPCNSVELVSMASASTYPFAKAIKQVAEDAPFDPSRLATLFSNPQTPDAGMAQHPALSSPHHQAMIKLIRDAKSSIFFNAIIFGGRWGSELVREMLLKANEDQVEVVILRDTRNSFAFASELVPLWESLVAVAREDPRVTVLQADIQTRMLSGLPFGIDRLTSFFDRFAKEGISLSGRSDHSKILVVDGFDPKPSMLVSSKNPSDYNLLNYDESAIVRGPAAAAAQMAFMPDIRLAERMAMQKKSGAAPLLNSDDRALLSRWYEAETAIRDPKRTDRLFLPQGNASVEISENNADDSVRNAELGVLHLLESAQTSVRMYHFLTYNPAVARALARAAHRLGPQNVRVLADATLTFALNVTFLDMLERELKSLGSSVQASEIVRWRVTAPPIAFPKESGRIGITQQQHSKSIVVDDAVLYLGSTNFDFASLAGAFRELSVRIEDPSAASQSAALFDAVWSNPKEWMDATALLQTGGPTASKVPDARLRSLLVNTIRTEQDRIGALVPDNVTISCQHLSP